MSMRVVLSGVMLAGCASVSQPKDFFKAIEGKAHDQAAEIVSEYCERVTDRKLDAAIGGIAGELESLENERIEARREIRQRGENGPPPPENPLPSTRSETSTEQGRGPVVRVWCTDEPVPEIVWADLVRIRHRSQCWPDRGDDCADPGS